MEISQIRNLLIAVEELNLHRAAERLNITQSGLTKQITALENELGFEVLLRHEHRLVGITQAGEKFIAEVSRSLRILDDAILTSRAVASGSVGTLRIGVCEPALAMAFGHVLRECRRIVPNVGLLCREMRNDDQVRALRDNQLDVGLVAQPFAANGLGSEPLWSEGRLVFLPEDHVLASQEQVTVDDLTSSNLTIVGDVGPIGRHAQLGRSSRLAEAYRGHQTACRASGFVFAFAGFGAVVVPDSFAAISVPGIAVRPLSTPAITISAIWRLDEGSGLVLSFLRSAKAAAVALGLNGSTFDMHRGQFDADD